MREAVSEEGGAEAEGAVTLGTGMRPLATVGAEVLDPGRAVSEALATLRAEVGLLARVYPQVLHQIRAPGKLLSTHIAAKRLGPQVAALVAQEAAAEHKSFATIGADIWLVLGLRSLCGRRGRSRWLPPGHHGPGGLLPAVCPLVLYAGRTITKALAADATLVGLLPCVCPLVFHQVRTLSEALATFTTDSGALTSRDPGPRNLWGALGRWPGSVGLFTTMSPLVFDPSRAIPKALATDPALVRLLPCVGPLVFHQIGHLAKALATLTTHGGPITSLAPAWFSQEPRASVPSLRFSRSLSLDPQVIPGLDALGFERGTSYFMAWGQIFLFLEAQVIFLWAMCKLIRLRHRHILTPQTCAGASQLLPVVWATEIGAPGQIGRAHV